MFILLRNYKKKINSMSERQFDNFDQFATDYRQIHNDNIKISGADSDYFCEFKVLKIKEIENIAAPKILDLGCGDGQSSIFFEKHFPDCEYHGIDVSEDSIKVAKEKKLANSHFQPYDGGSVPFAEQTFDMVFIACVLHHVDFQYHEGILNEVKRVLKPGGRLYIFEHNPYNPVTVKVVNECPFDEDAVLLKPSYSKRLLNKIKFGSFAINYVIFFPRKGIFKKMLFLEKYFERVPLGGQYYVRAVK